ncbi:hypothetical protein [Nonlabens agnitus]|uniref:Restriction endonuclease n=1 Tax=Nonlabens agnitus TaxID=870484 RepID=A0A2S9WS51_9FLAO|nr:hypothetical protein [Nonlabens agnitus]PRP66288.1 hypothetical protein BST86_03865 [Nonlabens agnitus]
MIIDTNFKELKERAYQQAKKMVDNGLYSRFGLSLNQRIDKALLGCLGELAFEEFLKQNNVSYSLDTSDFTKTNSDEYDFLINEKKIDVKVAKKTTQRPPNDNWTYGYPEEQNPSSKDFVVVGWIDFNNEVIGFYGWIKGSQIAKYTVVTHNSFAGYKYMTPNHEFKWGAMNKDFDALIQTLKN